MEREDPGAADMKLSAILTINNRTPEVCMQVADSLLLPGNMPDELIVVLHRPTTEAAYSIRTRIFDAIAAAVPVITTDGGFAAELVAAEGLGIVVPPSDATAVAAAVRRLLQDDVFHAACVHNLERIRPRFAWPVVAGPLVEAVSRWQS
jgi:glycosyltransferase involved in cell wall biosynthesis